MEILSDFMMQTVFSVGVISLFGLLLALGRKVFVGIAGNAGIKTLLVTGALGTPVHELSHALFCLLFGHKITGISLYRPRAEDGTIGYVEHSYNPRNIYQQIGNFFIGIAPILGGSAVIFLLMRLLVPALFADVLDELRAASLIGFSLADASSYGAFFGLLWEITRAIFGFSNAGNGLWWLFIVLALVIASHMELSGADLLGGLKGFVFVALLLLAADAVMYFAARPAMETLTAFLSGFAAVMSGFLSVAVLFSWGMVLIALLVRGICGLARKG